MTAEYRNLRCSAALLGKGWGKNVLAQDVSSSNDCAEYSNLICSAALLGKGLGLAQDVSSSNDC